MGSVLINGACGCDSTGSTKLYIANTKNSVTFNAEVK